MCKLNYVLASHPWNEKLDNFQLKGKFVFDCMKP